MNDEEKVVPVSDHKAIEELTDRMDKLDELREEELLDLIRATIEDLHLLGDRLENYVKRTRGTPGEVMSDATGVDRRSQSTEQDG